jgi:hypothetical protein
MFLLTLLLEEVVGGVERSVGERNIVTAWPW